MRRAVRSTIVALLTIAGASAAAAQGRTPEAIAAAVPVEVPEMISGGTWRDDKQTGVYRALVVLSGSDRDYAARVFLQWIGVRQEVGRPEVIRTVPLKEINDKKPQHAFITLDTENDNEATLMVTTIDPATDKELVQAFRLGLPGIYKVVEAPPSSAAPQQPAAPPAAGPPAATQPPRGPALTPPPPPARK